MEEYADRIIREAQRIGMAGAIDIERVVAIVGDLQSAIAVHVKDFEQSQPCPECGRGMPLKARDLKLLIASLDECARLIEFCKGAPESRREVVGGGDVLSRLSDEQLEIVRGWLSGEA